MVNTSGTHREDEMSVMLPFHSTKDTDRPKIYHDNALCEDGARIEAQYLARGTDNRPRCPRCRLLDLLDK
jgi:hypothetical protein